jgi:hypothetical protein
MAFIDEGAFCPERSDGGGSCVTEVGQAAGCAHIGIGQQLTDLVFLSILLT